MARDLGVAPDIMDRHFRRPDETDSRRQRAIARYDRLSKIRERRAAVAALEAMWRTKPLKPPGR